MVEHVARPRLVIVIDEAQSDKDLVAGLVARQAEARREVVRRYGRHVRAILVRLLGAGDTEHPDLLQDVFVRVFEGIETLRSPDALKAWIGQITVFVVREHIRRRRRWRLFSPIEDIPEPASAEVPHDGARDAVRCVYDILGRMPTDERLVLTLNVFHGMPLEEIAPACGMSYATARRRLAAGKRRFLKYAGRVESLKPWITS